MVDVMGGLSDNTMLFKQSAYYFTTYMVTHLCYLRIARQQSPVNVCAISNVRVVVLCGCGLQDFGDKALRLVWLLEE
jgi:hypothetical protein